MRLRQIVIAAGDIERVEGDLATVFGWQVAFRDPIVAKWGLRNIVIPVGDEFIEVVSPFRENTSAGRHRARLGGDGGYMVMFQVADRGVETARLVASGVRVAYRSDQATYCLTQFHPADCGGLILAWEQVLHPDGTDWHQPDGYWHAANGVAWRGLRVRSRVGSIRRVVLGGASGPELAKTYSKLLSRAALQEGGISVIRLPPGPEIAFENRAEAGAIVRIEVETHDRDAVLNAAASRGIPVDGGEMMVAGVGFRLV